MSALEFAETIRKDQEEFLERELQEMLDDAKRLAHVDNSFYKQIATYEKTIRATIARAYERNIKFFLDEEMKSKRRRKERKNQLAKFANDPQNVHTEFLVSQIKEAVKVICAIVPVLKKEETLFEIITECNLGFDTVNELTTRYLVNEDIYELGPGIYKRVIDSVWQFIRTSTFKTEIIKALQTELRDSVGMCAQGNLSRLCNVLKGYMNDLDFDLRSKSEQLGSRFSAIIGLEDRLEKGRAILLEMDVPKEEWPSWLDALN